MEVGLCHTGFAVEVYVVGRVGGYIEHHVLDGELCCIYQDGLHTIAGVVLKGGAAIQLATGGAAVDVRLLAHVAIEVLIAAQLDVLGQVLYLVFIEQVEADVLLGLVEHAVQSQLLYHVVALQELDGHSGLADDAVHAVDVGHDFTAETEHIEDAGESEHTLAAVVLGGIDKDDGVQRTMLVDVVSQSERYLIDAQEHVHVALELLGGVHLAPSPCRAKSYAQVVDGHGE